MVSGQEKPGLPLFGNGSGKEHGYGFGGQAPGHSFPVSQELEDEWENPTEGNRKAILLITSAGLHYGAASLPQGTVPQIPSGNLTTNHPTPWPAQTLTCGQMASAVGIRRPPGQGAKRVIILHYWVWQEREGKVWFWQHC